MKKQTGRIIAGLATFSLIGGASLSSVVAAPQTQLPVTKTLTIPDGATKPIETFTFTLTPKTPATGDGVHNAATKLTHYTGVALAGKDTITISSADITNNTQQAGGNTTTEGSNNFTFDGVDFNRGPGIYEYTAKETPGSTAGMTYDNNTYDIYLVVNADKQVVTVYSPNAQNDDKVPVAFANTYTTQALTVRKSVTGNMGDKNKQFDFTLDITADQNLLPTGTQLTAKKTTAAGQTTDVTVTVGTQATFTLADTESLTLAGIPQGVDYAVAETDYTAEGYTTTIADDDGNNDGAGTMDADGATVAFTNNKDVTVDTGIQMKVLPFAIIAAAGVGAGIFFFARKKKSDEA